MNNPKPDLQAVLEHYDVDVPGRTGWAKIKCPIHDDTHASAACNLDEQAFACFTCDVKGDVYTLIMAKEKVGFKDAVKLGESHAHGSVRPVHGSQDAGLLGVSRGTRHHNSGRGFFQTWHV